MAPVGKLKNVKTREVFTALHKNPRLKDYDEMQVLLRVNCEEEKAALTEVTYVLQGQAQEKVTIQAQNLSFRKRFHRGSGRIFWGLVCAPIVEPPKGADAPKTPQ